MALNQVQIMHVDILVKLKKALIKLYILIKSKISTFFMPKIVLLEL